jgi:3-isopropylmalate/(R)-2-methylmalate dehydratase small subunit
MPINGRVFKYGDDINTDVIFPGKYTYTITDRSEMAKHALEDLDPTFVERVKAGDVVVAGKNFGCGSSREQAATCLKEAGVGAVIAESFARLFFRNAINEGLPVIELKDAPKLIEDGETIEIDLEAGKLRVKSGEYSFPALPPEVMGIVEAGGLIPHAKKSLGKS